METSATEVATPPLDSARFVQANLPPGGLFAEQHWRVSPAPFSLGPELAKEIETLGRVLHQFYRATNLLYRQSVVGKQPAWIAQWLDQGKTVEVVERQRLNAFKNETPRVIRPDLLLTENGFAVTELDSVPGGIGLTAWLNSTYSQLGFPVLGGADGMKSGFAGIFGQAPQVHIVVSEEAASYRPEMEWLANSIDPKRFHVRDGAFTDFAPGDAIYRFFELFDFENVPASGPIFQQAALGNLKVTPPPKPILEEKMLFALLWNQHLRSFWRQELGEAFLNRMLRLTPRTWLVDPAPIPPHAAIPELNLTDWQQLKGLSQKERELILKISGYSPDAWGSRGVYLGSDLSGADWASAVDRAIASFPTSPYILQRFHKTRLVESQFLDATNNTLVPMPGRVRLCPYYFVHGEGDAARPQLGGVLATICPADKKIIHGMRDAILAPCMA